MKSPSRARVSGSMARRSSPLYSTVPFVTSYSGWPHSTRASVLLPDPFGPMIACTWPRSIDRSTPRRISRPPPRTCRFSTTRSRLSNAALQADAQELLRLDGEFHRQVPEHFPAEAAHDQIHRILGRQPALPAIEDLVLADFRCRRFVLDARRRILD